MKTNVGGGGKNLPIFFPNNAEKWGVTREKPNIYWKQENGFPLWHQVLGDIRPEDYESAALTI
jgi:hypothetical protein